MSATHPEMSKYYQVRNGFVVASLLLVAITVYSLVRTGSYRTGIFGVLIASQVAFWGSRLYYE